MAFDTPNTLPANNPTVGDLIDTTLISTSTPEGYVPDIGYEQNLINQYNQQFKPQEIGAQPLGSLYPGLNHNINVGGYSGQVIGSGNIYVPGGNIMALNPVLERRKAIDDAARKRAAEISKPFESPKTPQFTDQKFQQRLNKDYNGFIGDYMSKAKSLYGDNWKVILQDQGTELGKEFQQGLQNYETTVKNLNQVTDMVATIEKGLADNTLYLSPEKRKVYDEYKKMLGSFSDYDTFSKQDIGELHSVLMAERDLNDYFNKSGVLSTIEPYVKETYYVNDKGEYYQTGTNKKTSYKEIIDELATELKKTTMANSSYSLEDIKANLSSRLKDKIERTGGITQKTEAVRGRELAEEINAWDTSSNSYSVNNPKVQSYFDYDESGQRGKEYNLNVLQDYNMNLKGDKNVKINERIDGEVKSYDFDGFSLTGIEVLQSDGKTVKVIPGNAVVKIGPMRKLDNGIVIHDSEIAVPTKIKTGKKIKTGQKNDKGEDIMEDQYVDTYTIEKRPIVVGKNGKGTGTASKIKNQIKNDKKKEFYDDAFRKMTTETKPSSGNNVSYTIKGKKYSLSELEGMGYSASDVEQYKD